MSNWDIDYEAVAKWNEVVKQQIDKEWIEKDRRIAELQQQVDNLVNIVGHSYRERIAVLERALKLACEEFAIGGACVYCDHMAEECKDIKCPNNFRHYYKNLIEQAEKELKGEKQ